MKKFIFPFLLALFFMSCSDDITTNTPSLQGQTDYGYFHANNARIHTNEDGTFTMIGEQGSKVLRLNLNSLSEGVEYVLGGNSANSATYKMNDVLYSTDSLGEGKVKINYIREDEVFGTFNFSARVNGHTGDTITFSQGAFFGVRSVDGTLVPDNPDNGGDDECSIATQELSEAYEVYLAAEENKEEDPETYTEACEALGNAILTKAIACEESMEDAQNLVSQLDCYPEA